MGAEWGCVPVSDSLVQCVCGGYFLEDDYDGWFENHEFCASESVSL